MTGTAEGALIRRSSVPVLPYLIEVAGDRAALRFLEYFTVKVRNQNTRAAYVRAAADLLNWCEGQGLANWGACSRCMWPRIWGPIAMQ
jgi:hypothetical protein